MNLPPGLPPLPTGVEPAEFTPASTQASAQSDSASSLVLPPGLPPLPKGVIPSTFETAEDHYGSPIEKLKTFGEGVGQGLVGPISPLIERGLGVKPEDIRGRAEANPYTSGAGEFAGLVIPALATAGSSAGARAALASGEHAAEGASLLGRAMEYGTVGGLMEKAGNLATGAVGLGNLSKDAGYFAKVGSSVVRNMAEMAIIQSADETSKMAAQDDMSNISVESALVNVGLAAGIGGITGGVLTGAVSPIWKATNGLGLGKFLNGLKFHLDSETNAVKNLAGVTPATESMSKYGADTKAQELAKQYMTEHNLPHEAVQFIMADPERGAKLAAIHEMAQHAPNDPKVRADYGALIKESLQQFEALKRTGMKIEPIPSGMQNPYKGSAGLIDDIRQNNHMWYFPTRDGFGASTGKAVEDGLPKNFSAISAQVGDVLDPAKHSALREELQRLGYKVSDTVGNYGGKKEASLMVEHDGSKTAKDVLDLLGKQYGQESVLHSSSLPGARWNEFHYSDGRPIEHGFGLEKLSNAAKDFTESPDYGKFQLQFNPGAESAEHPLLGYSNILGEDGHPMQYNDIFRIVHDYFGHNKEGVTFGPHGEENAWLQHSRMFSPQARRAMTAETRLQNSEVNFGKNAANNSANPAKTIFADQKAYLPPAWTTYTGVSKGNVPGARHLVAVGKEGIRTGVDALANQSYESLADDDSLSNRLEKTLHMSLSGNIMRPVVNGEARAIRPFLDLNEIQHKQVRESIKEYENAIQHGAARAMGVDLKDLEHYDNAEEGNTLRDTFLGEFKQKYAGTAKQMEERARNSAGLELNAERRAGLGEQILKKGMEDVRQDSPYYPIYEQYAQRVAGKERGDVQGMDMLRTELYNRARSIGDDPNAKRAYHDIRDMVGRFVDSEIDRQDIVIGKEGAMNAADVIAQRAQASKNYAQFSKTAGDLTDHLGISWQRGAESLMKKVSELSPEDLAKKFSPRNNAEFIPFLAEHFPETLKQLQQLEAKKFMSPSVYREGGELKLDVAHLNRRLDKLQKGATEYSKFVLPPNAQHALQTAQEGLEAIPKVKSSGTGGWVYRLMQHPFSSAISAIGYLGGHNPISTYLLSEVAQYLGKKAPEAAKLSYLKFLASDQKVDSGAFKQMFHVFDNAIKGTKLINKSVQSVFDPGSKVAIQKVADRRDDREKLDKIIAKAKADPQSIAKTVNPSVGHYIPAHATSLAAATTKQIQYLATLKPSPLMTGPLGQSLAPSPMDTDRYNSALDIANNPAAVVQKIRDGSIQSRDVQDLKALYPNMHQQIQNKLLTEVSNLKANQVQIPYKTKVGLSLFLGVPMDNTLSGQAIMNIQKTFQKPDPNQPQSMGKTKKGTSTLGHSNKSYRTPAQAAEADRGGRDE